MRHFLCSSATIHHNMRATFLDCAPATTRQSLRVAALGIRFAAAKTQLAAVAPDRESTAMSSVAVAAGTSVHIRSRACRRRTRRARAVCSRPLVRLTFRNGHDVQSSLTSTADQPSPCATWREFTSCRIAPTASFGCCSDAAASGSPSSCR